MATASQSLIDRLRAHAANGWQGFNDEQISQAIGHLQRERADRIDALSRQEVASFGAGPLFWLTRHTKNRKPAV
jgi:hypothetical protein